MSAAMRAGNPGQRIAPRVRHVCGFFSACGPAWAARYRVAVSRCDAVFDCRVVNHTALLELIH